MKKDTIDGIYQTADGDLLYRAGFRLHPDGHWRRTVDSCGLGLTPREQQINDRGGLDYGRNTRLVISAEIAEARRQLEEFTQDEIDGNDNLRFLADWLSDATRV